VLGAFSIIAAKGTFMSLGLGTPLILPPLVRLPPY